jgi:hypothetical protein
MKRRAFFRNAIAGTTGLASLGWPEPKVISCPATIGDSEGAESKPPHMPSSARTLATYRRMKTYLDSIPIVDMHEHLRAFDQLPGYVETDQGRGMNLFGLWQSGYLTRISRLTPWEPKEPFENWWGRAKGDFAHVRAATFYRYMWLALRDLYGLDFDKITDAQAAELNRRIFDNYRNPTWLHQVLKERANIKVFVGDRFWKRFDFQPDYDFEFLTFNVTTLVWGFHPSEFDMDKKLHAFQIKGPLDDPYVFALKHGLPLNSLDEYLNVLEALFSTAKKSGAVCLKTTQAYERALRFEPVPKERAAPVFGHPRSELTPEQIKDFEDFVMWRLVELSAKYEIPFQIHTGDAKIAGSNPLLLVNLIDANPQTKFELFHGGYPWVGETGAICMKYPDRVWINSVWLPSISYTMAKRAFHEWLDVVPSNRITVGGDDSTAEGIYGELELTRRCVAEVLVERVDRGDLAEEDARQIGKNILHHNALELYPRLREHV